MPVVQKTRNLKMRKSAEKTASADSVAKQTRQRSKDSRALLIAAAQELFWQKGFAETTLIDVRERAGVSGSSLFHFFKTKEDLLLAVLDRYSEMLGPVLLTQAWAGVSDPLERVFALLAFYRKAINATNYAYGCPIGRLAMEVSPEMIEAHEKIAANFEGWSRAVRNCLEAAGKRLPREVDRDGLSRLVLAVMEGAVMQARAYRSIAPFDAAVESLRDYFERLQMAGVGQGASYWDVVLKK
jgi:TetR/AcrR family transcriptional regulator, transcriptional repressor for nem operon